jgi:ATP-binding cassette subfamily B (MDR/TAP) protein 1
MDLKTKWYRALLRQDLAYFDIQDVSGTAMTISTNAAKFQRGVGNKLGLFSQFMATFLGGMIYAFYSSWQTSLVVLLTVPFMAISGWFLVKMTSTQSQRKNASYAEAGAIVYTTVTSIRTILSLNGAQTMIDKFQAGTTKAYHEAVSQVHWLGVANGSIMSSFLLASVVVPLFGGYLLYDQVQKEGCDPSGGVPGVPTCDPSGEDIFGAMFGIFFSASVLPQITTTLEAITEARSACFLALQVMNRKAESASSDDAASAEEDSTKSNPVRRQVGQATALTLANLPKYEIDSLSLEGKQLENVEGAIEFQKVSFSYPTRMETKVFQDFSLKIQAGSTVALVGASGSGKSTIAQLFERFYDPSGGSVTLDGHDLKDLNLAWLRQNIGLVSQEPALFATSIRENIAYGLPGGATMEHIEEAAKVANAHDFITDFPDGYETQVGDKGAKLSGGKKEQVVGLLLC